MTPSKGGILEGESYEEAEARIRNEVDDFMDKHWIGLLALGISIIALFVN